MNWTFLHRTHRGYHSLVWRIQVFWGTNCKYLPGKVLWFSVISWHQLPVCQGEM
jgi:hypothetical protein